MNKILIIILVLIAFPLYPRITACAAENNVKDFESRGDSYVKTDRYFLAIEEYKKAIELGRKDPMLFRKLTKIYYALGFIDDAIVQMEKAVKLSPDVTTFRVDLGVLYMVKDHLEQAEKEFEAALKINPGFTSIYVYLGEVFFKKKEYDMAWLAARLAQQMGHPGHDLIRKLEGLAKEPQIESWDAFGDGMYIRQILVRSGDEAADIAGRISRGELFENVASGESMGPNASRGGYMGLFTPEEMDPRISSALMNREILSSPVIVTTEKGFHLVQRIVPYDYAAWKRMIAGPSGHVKKKTGAVINTVNGTDIFIVYSGAFKDRINADNKVSKLNKHGYQSYSSAGTGKSGNAFYKVVVGKYGSFEEAAGVKKRLMDSGYKSFIVKNRNGQVKAQ